MRKPLFILIIILLMFVICPFLIRQSFSDEGKNTGIPIVIQLDRPKSSDLTGQDLKEIALRYKAISDRMCNLSKAQIETLHQLNPNIKVFRYINFSGIYGKNRIKKVLELNPECILKDKSGNLEPSLWEGKKGVSVDPANLAWRNYLVEECFKAVSDKGYDGIMADEIVMVNILSKDFKGVNPKTGKVYTTKEWRDAQYESLKAVKKKIGKDKLLIANSVAYGKKYFDEYPQRFFEVVDGVVAENFRGPANWLLDKYFSEEDWKKDVDMLIDVQLKERYIVAGVKYNKEIATDEIKKAQYEIFMLATFLLGKGESCFFSSQVHDKQNIAESNKEFNPLWNIELGKPLDSYYKKDGLYQRDFQNAKVIVNPSNNAFTTELKDNYKTLEGKMVSKSISLNPHTAVILFIASNK